MASLAARIDTRTDGTATERVQGYRSRAGNQGPTGMTKDNERTARIADTVRLKPNEDCRAFLLRCLGIDLRSMQRYAFNVMALAKAEDHRTRN